MHGIIAYVIKTKRNAGVDIFQKICRVMVCTKKPPEKNVETIGWLLSTHARLKYYLS